MATITGGNALLDPNYILEKAKLGEGMRVADLGCGTSGHFVFPAARIVGKKGKVFAVDILKTALENINRRVKVDNFENIETIWSNLEIFGAAKIESSSLDVAMLINTLYQSNKRGDILREAVRLLKKGGNLLVVEWRNISLPFGPPASERVDQELIKTMARKLGTEIKEEFNAGQYHYGMLFVKM
ncbi:MAG: methyltransferase domain-containing protein [Patescibacteria group bacterium]|nr:methyltransferase domain-containing protein [Patescibacteria group bacterium]MDD4610600.1 methyltransferase domain-containing protein [Patescibacteria group bacterium]